MKNLELSQDRISEMFENREAFAWAKKLVNKEELSEEEVAFTELVNSQCKDIWKLNKAQAREEIAQLILKIVEPEIFAPDTTVFDAIFNVASYGEFDKIEVRNGYKNTLVAHESAARTGNVDKSYIDFTVGTVVEKHIQIETEIKMSDLRRAGALSIALLSMYAVEEFTVKKVAMVMDLVDKLIPSGSQVFSYTGAMTDTALNSFTGYLADYAFAGSPTAIGLSDKVREATILVGDKWFSDNMKDEKNNNSFIRRILGTDFISVPKGKKTGKGEYLVPENSVVGFAGKVGEYYTKGEMRTLSSEDINSEIINLKFTGVEFGFRIDDITKICKLLKTV